MPALRQTVLRYTPAMGYGEQINLAAILSCPEYDFMEFVQTSNWARVEAFDNTLHVGAVQAILDDIRDMVMEQKVGTDALCAEYRKEFHFDEEIPLQVDSPARCRELANIVIAGLFRSEHPNTAT